MQSRRRFKRTTSLQDGLSEFVNGERAKWKACWEAKTDTNFSRRSGRHRREH
jgi:hypothetical protein